MRLETILNKVKYSYQDSSGDSQGRGDLVILFQIQLQQLSGSSGALAAPDFSVRLIYISDIGRIMNKINREKIFLGIGIAGIILFLLILIVFGAISPGYSHIKHVVSLLGTAYFPYFNIFNAAIILLGLLFIPAGMGFYYSVKRITGRKVLAVVIGITVGIYSIHAFLAGLYPLPDPLHGFYGIAEFIHSLTLPFLAWAFWKIQRARFFILYQFISFILMIIAFFNYDRSRRTC